jgi:hypothetical protein
MSTIRITRSKAKLILDRVQQENSDENAFLHPNKRAANDTGEGVDNSYCTKNQQPVIEPKRLKISQDELAMNGAPEGELYGEFFFLI